MQCTFCYKYKEKLVRFKWILWDVENPTNEELENVTWHAKSLFNNKEMEKNMITDEQGREWLLQKFYDDGWLYYYKAGNGCMYLSKEKPAFRIGSNEIDPNSGGTTKCTDAFVGLIPEMQLNEVLDITKELGIIDWFKVPINTPILVRDSEWDAWKIAHFAQCREGHIFVWEKGKTSYTTKRTEMFSYAKLVGDTHE
jgi:hypothetical protein|nr:MAG TPA: hypothetical protein [Caudoviricetes sp.]DAV52206.1 MAG TPA: hypothetical protein [Caudoviricetes sp.]